MYGLTKKQCNELLRILFSYQNEIFQVKLFGSRARNDYKKTSDIDIAVKFLKPVQTLLANSFYESKLPYSVDVIDLKTAGKNLLKNIECDGKLLFLTEKGCVIMTLEQVKIKHEDFTNALKKLKIALEKDISVDDLYLDGIIQRFEFCFELSWKLMQAFLAYDGFIVNSPRSAIRKSFEAEIISDAEKWIDMLENRNLTTHTYDEETALEIYKNIAEKYIFMFEDFNKIITEKLK